MKHIFISLFILTGLFRFSVQSLVAQHLEVYLDYKRFSTPEHQGIFEVYLQFNALSAVLKRDEEKMYSAKLEITQMIKKQDQIVDFKKYIIDSPKMADTMIVDFIDQQRFLLEPGDYELELNIVDLNLDKENKTTSVQSFSIKTDPNNVYFSDIQAIERYSKTDKPGLLTKSGIDIIPYVSNYYPPEIDKLAFYAEIYNTGSEGSDEKFVFFQYIEDRKNNKQLNEFSKFTKQTSKPVIPVLGVVDITKLPPGDYNLVLELRNSSNEIVAKKKWYFQRNNILEFDLSSMMALDIKATFVQQITSEDSLNEYISSLRPIAQLGEITMIDTIVKSKNLVAKQKFFYSFWLARNGLNPDYAWLDYKAAVQKTQELFGTQIKKGYMTDRGYVFLKYGPPDYLYDKSNEPTAYPYQIWQYKKADKFNNRRFIFYLPDLVTNDYVLLHSEVPGEVKNYRWEQVIGGRTNTNTNIDDGSSPGQWGNNSREMFRNPR